MLRATRPPRPLLQRPGPPLIEITIPVLNEEQTLAAQVRTLRRFLDEELPDLAPIGIVIADNGSSDRTPELARGLAEELTHLRYLRLEERGVGRALKAAWHSSEAEIVGYMDLDLATDLRHLRPALTPLTEGRADIVAGSRLIEGARVVGRKLSREVTSRAFNLIVKAMFSTRFSDGQCGFKFLRRELLPRLEAHGAASNGWIFASELLIVGEHLGLRVLDLPVVWTDSPESKVRVGRLAVEYLGALRSLRRKLSARSAAR